MSIAPPSFCTVPSGEMCGVVRSRVRLVSRAQAMMFATIADMVYRDPGAGLEVVEYRSSPGELMADELRIACGWSRARADRETELAVWLVHLFPDVWSALHDGEIDLAKTQILHRYLSQVPLETARAVCAEVLPGASGWLAGRLAQELRIRLVTVDPASARERYERALVERRQQWYLADDGSASLSVSGLAPDVAAAAATRIDQLARQLRRRRHPGTLAQIRVDVLAALLCGTLEGLTRPEILEHLLAQAIPVPKPGPRPESRAARPPASGAVRSYAGRDIDHSESGNPTRATAAPTSWPQPRPQARTAPHSKTASKVSAGSEVGVLPGVGAVDAREWQAGAAASGTPTARPGSELRVQLATLLGENEYPGESLQLKGPVLSHVARRIAAEQRGTLWVFAVCDHKGRLEYSGHTHHRPDHVRDFYRGGTIELQLTISQLVRWRANPPPGWTKIIRHIGELVDRWPDALKRLNSDPRRRFPRAELRRHVQLRDTSCQGPGGCARPARYCDWEHSRAHANNGATTTANGRAQCKHDHLLKSRGGWKVRTHPDGGLEWTSPLGQTYLAIPQPLMPPEDDPPPF
jgi:hypothetical protein